MRQWDLKLASALAVFYVALGCGAMVFFGTKGKEAHGSVFSVGFFENREDFSQIHRVSWEVIGFLGKE